MSVEAILWDGYNKIQGELVLGAEALSFVLSDFGNTDLEFDLPYKEVLGIDIHHIYGISRLGIQINSKNSKQNIFIVADPKQVREIILDLVFSDPSHEND